MDYKEYKAPKKNYWWAVIVWGLMVLNVVMFLVNLHFGSYGWLWISVAGVICSIYNVYMHHVKGLDPWN